MQKAQVMFIRNNATYNHTGFSFKDSKVNVKKTGMNWVQANVGAWQFQSHTFNLTGFSCYSPADFSEKSLSFFLVTEELKEG